MNLKTPALVITLACAGLITEAYADCGASATIAGTQRAYANGQKFERDNNSAAAFAAYVAAQEYTCETNPVEAVAAKRAAALALTLGTAAEKAGKFDKAFDFYDQGGQYAAADRSLMALVRAQPDSPAVFQKAREALEFRALPAFQSNNEIRIGITGAYRPDPKNLAEVLAIPATGAQRALQKEAAAFNEQYLRDYQQMIQSRPNDPTDMRAMQAFIASQQGFARKWGDQNAIKASRDALGLVRSWGSATNDLALSARIETQRKQRIEQRVATLTKNYSGAPKLLEDAMDYQSSALLEDSVAKVRIDAIKAQALRLGDEASARQRLMLAAEYYDVAGDDAKATAARDQQQKAAMTRMQPSIDQMKKQAEQMQKEFSDPAKIQAMREQALAMQKSLQQQKQAHAGAKAQRADDLEKELGL